MFDDESETISENSDHAEELESKEQKRNQTSTIKSPLVKALLLKNNIDWTQLIAAYEFESAKRILIFGSKEL